MNKKEYPLILACLLFLLLFTTGIWLAGHRSLENDEFYTAVSSVENISFKNIFLGKISEGNNSPLFYATQKIFWALSGYKIPDPWRSGQWLEDKSAEIFLRLFPIFCMALMTTVIFYFFSRFYSILAGFYSLFLSLSSTMVWFYWTQGRPYALWMLLSAIQALIFLQLSLDKKFLPKTWLGLTAVNFFLSFTSLFGLIQIGIVSALLWLFVHRRWQDYIFLTVIPVVICIFYYINVPKYNWWFSLSPEQLIRECFSRDRFYILIFYFVFLLLFYLQKKTNVFRLFWDDRLLRGRLYFCMTVMMVGAACLILWIFKAFEHGNPDHAGFPVSSRYFAYLTPIGIIASAFFSIELMKSFQHRSWLQTLIASGIGYLVIHRFWKVWPAIKGIYSF